MIARWYFAGLLAATAPCAVTAATFDCVINPSVTLKIGSPVATTLQTIAVERGDRVRRGDVIGRLESSVEEADVALNSARAADTSDIASHQAKVEFAEAEAARAEALLANSNIPRQKVDEARTNLRVAQAELELAELNHRLADLDLQRSRALVEQKIIRSPIDGVVVQRKVGPGEFVHPDAEIVELAGVTPLTVEAYPPVRYFGAIKAGDRGVVLPDAPIASAREATVTVVDRVFDAGSGTFGVRLTLPNADGELPGGLRCRVTIDTGDR